MTWLSPLHHFRAAKILVPAKTLVVMNGDFHYPSPLASLGDG